MLRNCEKMVTLIPSTPNEWSQNNNTNNSHIDDPKISSCFNNNMDPPPHHPHQQKVSVIAQQTQQHQQPQQQQQQQQKPQQQQQNQEPLRCPRCDSTNTKFCYYNNYSLTQPRHFCKACKRYWTRGGTLRNVPVGGGCRKNKRVKRPPNNNNTNAIAHHHQHHTSSSTTSLTHNNSGLEVNSASSVGVGGGYGSNIHDLISSGSNHVNHPLFYGLPTNPDMNFPFSRYDLHQNPPPHMNGLGLGFSSSGLVHNMNTMNIQNQNQNHPQNTKQIFQDLISSSNNPLLSNFNNHNHNSTTSAAAATTTTNTTTTTPSLSSLLAQMKGGNNNNNNNNNNSHNFQTLLPSYEDAELHMKRNNNGNDGMLMKGVKMEFDGQNRSSSSINHWINNNTHQNSNMDQNMGSSSSDPSSILWGNSGGANNLNAWLDPSNNHLGSSVPSLI